MQILNEKQSDILLNQIHLSTQTHNFVLDKAMYYQLGELFQNIIISHLDNAIMDNNLSLPNFNYPLKDIQLTLSFLSGNNTIRVILFEQLHFPEIPTTKITYVGAIIQTDSINNHLIIPLALNKTTNTIYPIPGVAIAIGNERYKHFIVELDTNTILHRTIEILSIWYVIQLSLFIPELQTFFSYPQKEKIKKIHITERQPKIKTYFNIKKYQLNDKFFNELLLQTEKLFLEPSNIMAN